MSDETKNRGKAGIPSWQRAHTLPVDSKEQGKNESASPALAKEANDPITSPTRTESTDDMVLQQAFTFLKDPAVQDAPLEKKMAFLKSKGVTASDIEKVLSLDRTIVKESPLSPKPVPRDYSSTTPSAPKTSPAPYSVSRDIPPIITYPEFLLKPQKPPPIITIQRLINTAYVACGAAALVYGASQYLINPMTENLTSARHEFAEHSATQVDELRRRLAETVIIDPSPQASESKDDDNDDATSNAGSLDSDPSELFHRDFGTQTAPVQPAPPSSSSSSSEDDGPTTPTSTQANQLTHLKTTLASLIASYETIEHTTASEISTVIRVLNEQLDSLAYPVSSYAGIYSGGDGVKKDDDEIGRVKAEIRAVKGVLLSARSFKAPGRGVVGVTGRGIP